MSFADDFSQQITPRLRMCIAIRASHVASGDYDYLDARADIIRAAAKYGATALPTERFDAFTEWVDATLLEYIQLTERIEYDVSQRGELAVSKTIKYQRNPILTTIFTAIVSNRTPAP